MKTVSKWIIVIVCALILHGFFFWAIPLFLWAKSQQIEPLEAQITPPMEIVVPPKKDEPKPLENKPIEELQKIDRTVQNQTTPLDRPSTFSMDMGIAGSESGTGPSMAKGSGGMNPNGGMGAGGNGVIFQPGEVDVPAKLLQQVQPEMPPRALREGVSGFVALMIVVDPQGRVAGVDVQTEDPPGYGFAKSAERAVRQYRFSPAKKEGVSVPCYYKVPLKFSVNED